MSGQPSFVELAPVHPETSARFGDFHPPLDRQAVVPEANRCSHRFDAPCTTACPTHIDVPRFIKKLASGNAAGSARTILDAIFWAPAAPAPARSRCYAKARA